MSVDYKKDLNAEQLDVVNNGAGAALVIAGPGSGKTRTLIYRICKLLEQDENPESILLLTFTNKSAREMKERAEKLIGEQAKQITAGTFHHFANLLLRRHGKCLGIENNFTILDDQDSTQVLKLVVLNRDKKAKKGEISAIKTAISLSKLKMISLDALFRDFQELSWLKKKSKEISLISEDYIAAKKH